MSISGFSEEICWTVSKKYDRAKDLRIVLEIGGAGTRDILNREAREISWTRSRLGSGAHLYMGVSTNHR